MKTIKVRLATYADNFEEGDQPYLAQGRTEGGMLVVEPITIIKIDERSSTRGRGSDAISYSYKNAEWVSATGSQSGFTFASTDEAYVPNFKTDLFIADEDGIEVFCYEQIGTAITVTVLVAENDPDAASAAVMGALEDVIAANDEARTRPAYDRTEHYFTMEGEAVGIAVPHWHSSRIQFLPGRTAEGCEPVHKVQFEIMKDIARREAEFTRPRRGRPPGSKNKVKEST